MTDTVVTLVESNLRRPVHETLRRIADEIEAGKYGDYVSEAALVFMGDMTEVFVFGAQALCQCSSIEEIDKCHLEVGSGSPC